MFPIEGSDNQYIILDVPKNTSAKEGVLLQGLFCRACLATDGRLFNIEEYKLADSFSTIAGTAVIKGNLPQYLCSYCRALLLKCASFRDMCARTQQLLTSELLGGQRNAECIQQINQSHHRTVNLILTAVESFCIKSENLNITETALENDLKLTHTPPDINIINTLTVENIKHEPYIDIVDIDSIKIDEKIEFEIKIDDDKDCDEKGKVFKGRNIRRRKTRKKANRKKEIKDETDKEINVKMGSGSDKDVSDDSSLENDINVEIDDHSKVNNFSGIHNAISSVKKRPTSKEERSTVKKRKETINNGGKSICRKQKKSESKEKDETMSSKTFESDYSVKIVNLSKEEQLAEIAARKYTRNYLESRLKCDQCYKGFDAQAAYENHMVHHSPSSGAFLCEICRVRFPKNYKLTIHGERHRVKITCTTCNFVSRSKCQARQHHAVHAGRTYECAHCGKSFVKRSSQLSHIRLAHPELNLACDVCGEVFVGENGLKMHKAKMHSEKIKCNICSAKFINLAALNRHTDTAGEHSDLRPCEQCGENCASEQALHEHLGERHSTESRHCKECDMAFPTASACATHVMRSHLRQKKTEAGRAGRKRPYKHLMCEQCGLTMPSPALLTIHQRTHQGLKPFSCNECSKAFTTKQYLIAHIRSHSGEKPFQCPSCPLAFSQRSNFARHHRTVHLGVRDSFLCTICGSTSTTKSSLRIHIDSKHAGHGWPKSRKRARNSNKLK